MATIITKNSQTASAVPAASSLEVGELAVNTADGKLYTEHTGGVVKEIIPSTVVDGGITAAKIATNAVTSDKINASAVTTAKIADANVTIAKLSASGTPSSSTYLRGDNTWATVSSGGVTSLNGQTGAITNTDYGAIGSYLACLARSGMSKTVDVQSSPGTTIAGSGLYGLAGSGYGSGLALQDGDGSFKFYQQAGSSQQSSLGLSGTWRVLTFYRPATNLAGDVGLPVLVVRVS